MTTVGHIASLATAIWSTGAFLAVLLPAPYYVFFYLFLSFIKGFKYTCVHLRVSGTVFSKDAIVWTCAWNVPVKHIPWISSTNNFESSSKRTKIHIIPAIIIHLKTFDTHFLRLGSVTHHSQIPCTLKGYSLCIGTLIDHNKNLIQNTIRRCIEQPINWTFVSIASTQDCLYDLNTVCTGDALHAHGNLNVTCSGYKDYGGGRGITVWCGVL
mmetsp:Transcript_16714/g.24809  ORF Transcript_16714/g.24809 Transcript_16714/m.24809 type:complete len:212 (-) Transcript_16714:263-898(-)